MDLESYGPIQLSHGVTHAHKNERAARGTMGADIMIFHAEAKELRSNLSRQPIEKPHARRLGQRHSLRLLIF